VRVRLVNDSRAEVSEDVRVGVGAVECQLNDRAFARDPERSQVRISACPLTWASCSHACASVTKEYNVVPAYEW